MYTTFAVSIENIKLHKNKKWWIRIIKKSRRTSVYTHIPLWFQILDDRWIILLWVYWHYEENAFLSFFLVVLEKTNFPPFLKHTLPGSYGTKTLDYWCHRKAGFSSFPCSRQRCNINQKQGKGLRPKNFYDSLVSDALPILSTQSPSSV